MKVLILLLISFSCFAQTTTNDVIYIKDGQELKCNITEIDTSVVFFSFSLNRKEYNSSIAIVEIDSIYNGNRYILPEEFTLAFETIADSSAPLEEMNIYQLKNLSKSRVNKKLTLEQRSRLAGYYLKRSADSGLGALVTVVASGLIGGFVFNNSPDTGSVILLSGATLGLVLEISSLVQREKAGYYLMNSY